MTDLMAKPAAEALRSRRSNEHSLRAGVLRPLLRVLWQNGAVIGEEHFERLEEWVEELVGVISSALGWYGCVRGPQDSRRNMVAAVQCREWRAETQTLRVLVDGLRVVTRGGHFIDVSAPVERDVYVPMKRNGTEPIRPLWIRPAMNPKPLTSVDQSEDAVLYTREFELSIGGEQSEDAVQIGEIIASTDGAFLSGTFVLPCRNIGGSELLQDRTGKIASAIRSLAISAREEIPRLVVSTHAGYKPILELAQNVIRLCADQRSFLEDIDQSPVTFFRRVLGFLRAIIGELELAALCGARPVSSARSDFESVGPVDDEEKGGSGAGFKAVRELESLTESLQQAITDPHRLREALDAADNVLVLCAEMIHELLGRVLIEGALDIAQVEFTEGKRFDTVLVKLGGIGLNLGDQLKRHNAHGVRVSFRWSEIPKEPRQVLVDPEEQAVKVPKERREPLETEEGKPWCFFRRFPSDDEKSRDFIRFIVAHGSCDSLRKNWKEHLKVEVIRHDQ